MRKRRRTRIGGAIAAALAIAALLSLLGCSADAPQASDSDSAYAAQELLLQEQLSWQELDQRAAAFSLAEAQDRSEDVVAWLCVPGTNVSVPIVWRPGDNSYYVTHDIEGRPFAAGAAFADGLSDEPFSSPTTLVHGHSFPDASVSFTQLHLLDGAGAEQSAFFFVVFPDRAAFYRIESAGERTPPTPPLNAEGAPGETVLLSTCTMPARENARFVVEGHHVFDVSPFLLPLLLVAD